jgi:4a-hydroxytetrahydrobiopterin dehydratase
MVKTAWWLTKLYTNGHLNRGVPRLLTPSEIAKGLASLDGWKKRGGFIEKSFEFETFMEGIEFTRKVAAVAEEEEHHPDIRIRYTRVTLSIQTHSEGGVTEWDIGLARAIENMRGMSRSTSHVGKR